MILDFVTIEDAMKSGLIPENYHYIFKNYKVCNDPNCKAPVVINNNRTVMKCSNPNCPKILSHRVLKVYNNFGIINFGPSNAYNWVINFDIKDVPDAILKAPEEIKLSINNWISNMHTPSEIIEMLAIPGIGTKATKMMGNITNYNQFTTIVETFGRNIVLAKCGIHGKIRDEWWNAFKQAINSGYSWEQLSGFLLKNSSYNALPYDSTEDFIDNIRFEGLLTLFKYTLGGTGRDGENCAESVYIYWDELKRLFSICTCYPDKIESRKIIITGDIVNVKKSNGTPYERQEFIDYANTIAIKLGIRYQNSTAFNSSEFVIADYPSQTRKYTMGINKGNLISSDEFIKLLLKRVNENE